jgi:hypothetical protein
VKGSFDSDRKEKRWKNHKRFITSLDSGDETSERDFVAGDELEETPLCFKMSLSMPDLYSLDVENSTSRIAIYRLIARVSTVYRNVSSCEATQVPAEKQEMS